VGLLRPLPPPRSRRINNVQLKPNTAVRVNFRATAATRRAIRRKLRTRRSFRRTLVIKVRDKTSGKTYTIKRRLTFRRIKAASR
jgi:ribosomal protein S6